jgi:hypothetical protein
MQTYAERIAMIKAAEARVAARRAPSNIPFMHTNFLEIEIEQAQDSLRDAIARNRRRHRRALHGIQGD